MPKKPLPSLSYEVVTGKSVATMRAMIVGDPDTGKTTIAASASLHPDLSPLVFVDIDRRLTTLAGYDNINRVEIPTIQHAERLARDLSRKREDWPEVIRNTRTIVLDSVSLLRDHVMQEYADEAADNSRKPRSNYLYEQRDYGYVSNMVANLIDKLIQTGCHIILLSHQRTIFQLDKDDKPTEVIRRIEPVLNKRLQDLIGSMMHHIWYTKRPNAETFRLLTLPRKPYKVKVTNPVFVKNLKEYTRGQAEGNDQQASKAQGWVNVSYVPDSLPDTLPVLWDMYKDSVTDKTEETIND